MCSCDESAEFIFLPGQALHRSDYGTVHSFNPAWHALVTLVLMTCASIGWDWNCT